MEKTQIVAIFKRQGELLRGGWCKFNAAQDAYGASAIAELGHKESSRACKFCWIGALWRALSEMKLPIDLYLEHTAMLNIMSQALNKITDGVRSDWIGFNDDPETTHEDILRYSDECVAMAEAL